MLFLFFPLIFIHTNYSFILPPWRLDSQHHHHQQQSFEVKYGTQRFSTNFIRSFMPLFWFFFVRHFLMFWDYLLYPHISCFFYNFFKKDFSRNLLGWKKNYHPLYEWTSWKLRQNFVHLAHKLPLKSFYCCHSFSSSKKKRKNIFGIFDDFDNGDDNEDDAMMMMMMMTMEPWHWV